MIILSVDYGDARTGIAVCDRTELLAAPVTVISETDRDTLLKKIADLALERTYRCGLARQYGRHSRIKGASLRGFCAGADRALLNPHRYA